nr:myosin-2 heavy chain-like [Quercus suber]XP_023918535.1 myosin-2 heavy chain-like [Quercus suber]
MIEPTDLKRRRDSKDKEVVEAGRSRSTLEDEAQRAAKQQKAVQSTFRMEEITNSYGQHLDEERKMWAATVQTLTIAEQSNAQLKKKLAEEEHAQKSADSEQIASLKKQLEEAQRLRGQAEKAKAKAEAAKAEVEKEKDKAEQDGYGIGVAETEEKFRTEVPADVSSITANSAKEAQTQNLSPLNQQEQPKVPEISKDISSDQAGEKPKDGEASQSFEQALASTTLPAGGVQTDKEKDVPPPAIGKAPQSKLQIKLKPKLI